MKPNYILQLSLNINKEPNMLTEGIQFKINKLFPKQQYLNLSGLNNN